MFFYNGVFPFVADARCSTTFYCLLLCVFKIICWVCAVVLFESYMTSLLTFTLCLYALLCNWSFSVICHAMCSDQSLSDIYDMYCIFCCYSKFIQDKYHFPKTTAPYIAGSVYYLSMVISPFLGFIIVSSVCCNQIIDHYSSLLWIIIIKLFLVYTCMLLLFFLC